MSDEGFKALIVMILVMVGGGITCGGCYVYPHYEVYEQRLKGEAELARSEAGKKVLIQEATAKAEAAKMLAQAEIERAKGVAEANRIIGESLKDNDAYLRYLWIQQLAESPGDVVYVPTEANLPIMEAGRFGRMRNEARQDGGR